MDQQGTPPAPPPPPERVRSRRIFTGRIISLDVETLRYADGEEREVEVARHPGAAAVVPFLDDPFAADPRVLLIRQYRYAPEEYLLEIPAGRFEPNETPSDCAARELKEETGMIAGSLKELPPVYTTPGFTNEKIYIFIAWDLTEGDASPDQDEQLSIEFLPLSEAVRRVGTGEIADAKTALALLLAEKFGKPR